MATVSATHLNLNNERSFSFFINASYIGQFFQTKRQAWGTQPERFTISSVPTCTNSGACSDCAVLRVRTCDTLSESRMPKNGHRPQGGPSGSMSGSVKTVHGVEHEGTGNRKGRQPTKPAPKPPRHLSTLQFVSECYRIIPAIV